MGTTRRKPGNALAQSFPLTVVVPVHNGAAYLPKTLPALLANRLEGVEILVVDDGSTDETGALLESGLTPGAVERGRSPLAARPLDSGSVCFCIERSP